MAPPKQSIWSAAFQGKLSAVRSALDAGANMEELGPDGSNPLHLAAMAGHRDVVEFLLDGGADVNAVDGDGFSVLQVVLMAAGQKAKDRTELVRLLLERGADPEHEAPMAGNLITTARTYRRSREILELLESYGAPPAK